MTSVAAHELLSAAHQGKAEAVRHMLDRGVDVNSKDEMGQTPLIAAVVGNSAHCREVVMVLLSKGADVNAKTGGPRMIKGRTALHFAAGNNNTSVVKMLLEKGARIDAKNVDGETPLIIAASGGLLDAVKVLVDNGADQTIRSRDGMTAYMYARRTYEQQKLERYKLVCDLLSSTSANDSTKKEDKADPAVGSAGEVACVAAGSRISLPDGKQVPVESVIAGQSVLGYHDGCGRLVSARVTRVASHDPALVVRLSTDKGELIVTPKHRLLTEHGWTSVRDLIVGERVAACFPGVCGLGHARVESITPVKEPRPLYNLYIEEACTYVANGLITHSYVFLPNLRMMLNRLHLALTRLRLLPRIHPGLASDVVGRIHGASR